MNKTVIYSLMALLNNCGGIPKNDEGGKTGERDTFSFDSFFESSMPDVHTKDIHSDGYTQDKLTEKDIYSEISTQDISFVHDSKVSGKDAYIPIDSELSGEDTSVLQDYYPDIFWGDKLIQGDYLHQDIFSQDTSSFAEIEEKSDSDASCIKKLSYQDKDNDEFGEKNKLEFFCSEKEIPFGYVLEKEEGWDCNDNDNLINPLAEEVCDAGDNDCDGKIDEGLTLKQQCGDTNIGECKFGTELNFCLGGEYIGWQICDAVYPKEEVCDGKDNNCNGKTDEGLLLEQSCGTTDVGECVYGVEFNFCVGKYTGWQICDAVLPKDEICDGKDNNCNGFTDEGLTLEQECGTINEGGCELGVEYKYCKNGEYASWMDCTATFPIEEECNSLDDNCDGKTDEGLLLEQPCGVSSLGECTLGTEINFCTEGQYTGWKDCTAIFSAKEVCDSKDNDCDGKIDEELTLEKTCGVSGIGNCTLGIELSYCENEEYTEWLDCTAVFPSLEVCNGVDDDCNGLEDEGVTLEQSCGVTDTGECTLSFESKYCINGEYGEWLGCKAILPFLETCDYLDNNCNGVADENFSVGETCSVGEGICKSEGMVKCTLDSFDSYCDVVQGLPVTEKCDNLDNDCNGLIDENLVQTCYSVCGEGIEVCTTGSWIGCTASLPELEICDYVDNDCDDLIDEEFEVGKTCYVGGGECKSQGTVECTADGFDIYCTAVPKEPKMEICNTLDDDCNGVIDENLSQSCITACGSGLEKCINGNWKNCTALQPQQEICDGKDNDCNGKIDELIECCPLAGYWNFDEGAGNIAHDSSGKGNNGTVIGANWAEGKVNGALSFDGVNDYVNMSYYFNDLSPAGSVSLWFKLKDNWPNGDEGQFFLFSAKEGWAHNIRLELSPAGNFIFSKSCGLGNNAKNLNSAKNSFDKELWYQVVAVLNGADMWLYINGQLDESTFWVGEPGCSSGMHTQATSAYLGAYPANALYLDGSLDEVKVYSCALTEEQVLMEYVNSTKK